MTFGKFSSRFRGEGPRTAGGEERSFHPHARSHAQQPSAEGSSIPRARVPFGRAVGSRDRRDLGAARRRPRVAGATVSSVRERGITSLLASPGRLGAVRLPVGEREPRLALSPRVSLRRTVLWQWRARAPAKVAKQTLASWSTANSPTRNHAEPPRPRVRESGRADRARQSAYRSSCWLFMKRRRSRGVRSSAPETAPVLDVFPLSCAPGVARPFAAGVAAVEEPLAHVRLHVFPAAFAFFPLRLSVQPVVPIDPAIPNAFHKIRFTPRLESTIASAADTSTPGS